jgi:hypothetical protein
MHIHQLNYMCYRKLCNAVTNKPSNVCTAGQWTLGLCSVAMAGKSNVSKVLLMKCHAQFILRLLNDAV